MSEKAYHSQKRSDAQNLEDCGCTEGLECFTHYRADGGRTVDVDRELLPWEDHGQIRRTDRVVRLTPVEDEEPRRDWSAATVVRGESGLSRIDFSA